MRLRNDQKMCKNYRYYLRLIGNDQRPFSRVYVAIQIGPSPSAYISNKRRPLTAEEGIYARNGEGLQDTCFIILISFAVPVYCSPRPALPSPAQPLGTATVR